MLSITGFADELRFGWDDSSKLKIFGNPDANSVLTGAANAAAVFDVAHRHCFVWSQGNYIKVSVTPGLELGDFPLIYFMVCGDKSNLTILVVL